MLQAVPPGFSLATRDYTHHSQSYSGLDEIASALVIVAHSEFAGAQRFLLRRKRARHTLVVYAMNAPTKSRRYALHTDTDG